NPSARRASEVMTHNYGLMPQAFLPHLPVMVDALLVGETPMLVHCTAGKDRTGVVVAVFLELLGVPRAAIIEDYRKSDVFGNNLMTSCHLRTGLPETFGFIPRDDMVAVLIGVDERFLQEAFEAIDERWGGIEGYFEAAGVDADRRNRLRRLL